MMWWHGGHWGFGPAGGLISMGFMALFWILVIIGIIYLIRHSAGSRAHDPWSGRPVNPPGPGAPGPEQPGSSALRILEERYARGDIDRDEFFKRRADLTGKS